MPTADQLLARLYAIRKDYADDPEDETYQALHAAFLLAHGEITASTPIGKALASTAQFLGAGLATVGLADLTNAAAIDFGQAVGKIVIAAVATGLYTLAQNGAEQAS